MDLLGALVEIERENKTKMWGSFLFGRNFARGRVKILLLEVIFVVVVVVSAADDADHLRLGQGPSAAAWSSGCVLKKRIGGKFWNKKITLDNNHTASPRRGHDVKFLTMMTEISRKFYRIKLEICLGKVGYTSVCPKLTIENGGESPTQLYFGREFPT